MWGWFLVLFSCIRLVNGVFTFIRKYSVTLDKFWKYRDATNHDSTTHNYIIKYLIFCMESVFCDKINGTQFYRDQ
ncbi:hypothetical protein A6J42_08210 [Leptospira interrogans serovar Copenhageni]|nr:hypothetical protein A6J42_08210 [Leptospira interrogans serovar Copenhageni]ASP42740.1 hypothetical protein AMR47_18220 [Leptospira interrogans]OOB98240.1 hypothetical protein B0192_12695 [Leptospira interrogans serovar Australis]